MLWYFVFCRASPVRACPRGICSRYVYCAYCRADEKIFGCVCRPFILLSCDFYDPVLRRLSSARSTLMVYPSWVAGCARKVTATSKSSSASDALLSLYVEAAWLCAATRIRTSALAPCCWKPRKLVSTQPSSTAINWAINRDLSVITMCTRSPSSPCA